MTVHMSHVTHLELSIIELELSFVFCLGHVSQSKFENFSFKLMNLFPSRSGRTESIPEDFKLNMATATSSHMVGRCFVATETGTYFDGTGFLKAGEMRHLHTIFFTKSTLLCYIGKMIFSLSLSVSSPFLQSGSGCVDSIRVQNQQNQWSAFGHQ